MQSAPMFRDSLPRNTGADSFSCLYYLRGSPSCPGGVAGGSAFGADGLDGTAPVGAATGAAGIVSAGGAASLGRAGVGGRAPVGAALTGGVGGSVGVRDRGPGRTLMS